MTKCVLGDVADVIISGVDKKTKDGEERVRLCNYTDVYYNWAITGDKHDGLMEASAKPEEIRKFKIRKGQVALTKDSETRDDIGIPTYIADDFEDVILGYHCALITPHGKQLDGSYLNALLRTKYAKEFFANNAGGSGQRYYLSEASIRELPLFLPDVAEQKRIGKFLSSIDRKIALNRKRIATLEAMAKEIYDYWFVQFDFPDAHGRPYKSSGGAMVYNPDLKREIPKGWAIKTVGDIANVVTGKEDASFATDNGMYPFFTCSQKVLKCDEYKFDGKNVLVAGNGEFCVKHYIGKCNAYQRTYVISPSNVNYWGAVYIEAQRAIDRFKRCSSGSIVKFITMGDVRGLIVYCPANIDLYDPINQCLEQIENQEREIVELSALRDFILPVLMNGQVKVG